MMVFWPIFAAVVGVIVAVGLCVALGKTERSSGGSYNPQALSVIGSALLSTFILVTAFLIAGTWSTFTTDRQHTYDEARSVAVAYWLGGKLPDADRDKVRDGLTTYVNQVVAKDWPMMGKRRISDAAWTTLDGLRTEVVTLRPADAGAEKKRAELAAALDDVNAKRLQRAADVNYAMPTIVYMALIVGALLLIAYPPLVGLTANARNVALLGGLGAMVGLGIFIVIALSHPYSHPVRLDPTAFRQALERFAQINNGQVLG